MIRYWFSKDSLTGGNVYNRMALRELQARGLEVVERQTLLSYRGKGRTYLSGAAAYLRASSAPGDIDVMDYGTAVWASPRLRGRRVVTMFHFDPDEAGKPLRFRLLFERFLRAARDGTVVVIARHWARFLEARGLHRIALIPCGFDVPRYRPSLTRAELLRRFGLPDRPIVYLGRNSVPKTLRTYQQLRGPGDEWLLVTSGPVREFAGPVNLDLDFDAYVSLLHAAAVTVVLPGFDEGWSRIAHESVLCGTPVVGNGRGGMGELLEGARQTVVSGDDPGRLVAAVRRLVSSGERVAERDRQWARSFDLTTFGDRWTALLAGLGAGLPEGR